MNGLITKVELTERDAEQFIIFQQQYSLFQKFIKHQALIGLLDSLDIFDIRGGSCTIHFTSTGEIGSVDKQQHFKI